MEAEARAAEVAAEHEATLEKHTRIRAVLEYMKSKEITYGDLLLFMSDPTASSGLGEERYRGLFGTRGRVEQILTNWVSPSNSKTGRTAVTNWALEHVKSLVSKEGQGVTRAGTLQAFRRPVDKAFAGDFNMPVLLSTLRDLCPSMSQVLFAFSTTQRQQRKLSGWYEQLIGSALLILLRARSQRNSYVGHVMGLYLYATGASRQLVSVLSHMGLSSSYQTLAGTRTRATARATISTGSDSECAGDQTPTRIGGTSRTLGDPAPAVSMDTMETQPQDMRRTGILQSLSNSCRMSLRERTKAAGAAANPSHPEPDGLANVYDNINFMFRAAEQILGRKDSQENGTCATAFSLFKAPREYMRTANLMRSYHRAPPLTFKDLRLTREETGALRQRLIWTVMQIVVQHGGESFKPWRSKLTECVPLSTHRIPVHTTEIFPMPAMEIDESSTTGNAKVLDAMFTEMGYDLGSPDFTENVRIVFGDQLSMARVRAVVNTRVGHDDPSQSYLNVVFAPGFFHYQMAATHGVLETHWGDPSLGARDPGSLSFHNTVLDRKPIVLSSLPPYRTCRDLTFVSLYARVLHCLEQVSGHKLDEYVAKSSSSFEKLQRDAAAIVDEYANPAKVAHLRGSREEARRTSDTSDDRCDQGDPVYENAILFLRDALLLRHFADAIKSGTSDHLITVLKLWALGFRAMGRVKYAHELLHLLHNLIHVWPHELREIIMNNWLVNTTGKVNGFIPVDLLQEHLNFWIKVIYKAHGSNASWEWLETISPCIEILRQLANQINSELGSKQGVKHHSPDLTKDIHELMESLRRHGVYSPEQHRPDRDTIQVIPNVLSAGIHALAAPLAEYNAVFRKMQDRRAMVPIIGKSALETFGVHRDEECLSSTGVPGGNTEAPEDDPSSSGSESESSSNGGDSDGEVRYEGVDVDSFRDVFFALDAAEDVELDMDGY
ncbi:hypothetical protein OH77DRAFT_1465461 [Trametes cingulata]|nr:hypothetical protein OH77DRAFT_1465461 [Trametes cingulata]